MVGTVVVAARSVVEIACALAVVICFIVELMVEAVVTAAVVFVITSGTIT